jgi:hypothetical protein
MRLTKFSRLAAHPGPQHQSIEETEHAHVQRDPGCEGRDDGHARPSIPRDQPEGETHVLPKRIQPVQRIVLAHCLPHDSDVAE